MDIGYLIIHYPFYYITYKVTELFRFRSPTDFYEFLRLENQNRREMSSRQA